MARDTSFSYSFLVLPADQRRAIGAIWDFCRAVDDGVDEAVDRASAEQAVVLWRDEVARLFGDGAPHTEQARNLQPIVDQFALSRQPFDDLVDGVEMDLQRLRYDTFDDLAGYCRRVASAVGLMCIEVFGSRGPGAHDYAYNLGLALQVTNIIRDIKTDLDKGRIYVPQADLERFGVSEAMLKAGIVNDPVRALLAFECQRAHQFFEAAERVRPAGDAPKLVAAEIMGAIYYEILRRIEAQGYNVFGEVIRVPKMVRARIALRVWTRLSVFGWLSTQSS